MYEKTKFLPHGTLVKDFNSIVSRGFDAKVLYPNKTTARQVCESFLKTAWENATNEEKKFLPIIQKRIEHGSLSETIRKRIHVKAQRTDFREALIAVYSILIKSLRDNQPYF
jgi:hypothetical protein